MKMQKSPDPDKSTSDNLIDLYTRIPDYSEVKHLGQSDFINTLEKLKEEFRQCRASLYNEEFCSDSEFLAGRSSPVTNRSRTTEHLYKYTSKYSGDSTNGAIRNPNFLQTSCSFGNLDLTYAGSGKATKINNHNLTTVTSNDITGANFSSTTGEAKNDRLNTETAEGTNRRGTNYLSIKSCELHRPPYRSTSASSLTQTSRYLTSSRPLLDPILKNGKDDSAFNDEYSYDEDDDDFDEPHESNTHDHSRWSVVSSNSDISMSKWSSSPEIYRSRSKDFLPPSHTEQRSLARKAHNNSAPSVAFKDEPEEVAKNFKANPVPEHVYKPLYEFLMLKNQRRSEKVKEQSKRRLLAQVKPFSFSKTSNRSPYSEYHEKYFERSGDRLNNTKPLRKRRNDALGNVKINNNRFASTLFKAKPAPPRTRALLAAIRQKEQQDYRELKKRLRAEMLLKNASLPPSMAAREKLTRFTNAKIDEVLLDYQKSFPNKTKGGNRNFRGNSTGTEDTGLMTDEDRMTEDEFGAITSRKVTTVVRPFKFSQRTPRKFTSFGTSRHSAAAAGVFESSSNDNHASRLRYQAAKIKEQQRIEREEEEMLKIMRAEKRRHKLRDAHLYAWQHACSYSAEQDIEMRRQLRQAASILERDSYIKDMSCMLSRVRSAPLLLEGGNRLERRQELCRKHREETKKGSNKASADRPWNKLSTPGLYPSHKWASSKFLSSVDRYGVEEKSETVALAEGSLSNSDNESGSHEGVGIETDFGSSDLDEDGVAGKHADVQKHKEESVTIVGVGARKIGARNAENRFNKDNENCAPSTDDEINDEVNEDEDAEDGDQDKQASDNHRRNS